MIRDNAKGWLSLCLGALAILIVWMLVLPWIGSRTSVQRQIDSLDRQGVDPAALFYTDLEAMQQIETDLAAISQSHPDAFWRIGPAATE
jgi:hypothetical protein